MLPTRPQAVQANKQVALLMYQLDRARRAGTKGQTRKESELVAESAALAGEMLKTLAAWQDALRSAAAAP